MSIIYTGKDGYNSDRLWNERSRNALNHNPELYDYDTRLDANDQILCWLRQEFAKLDKPSVLEIGAGFGRWADGLKKFYSTFTGVDIVTERVIHARKIRAGIPNAHFELVSGVWNLGRKFDVVLSITVIQHLLMPQAIEILQAIERHLAPGGVALLAEWAIADITLEQAEAWYAKPEQCNHMIPKPLSLLKVATPDLEWSGKTGAYVLRRRRAL